MVAGYELSEPRYFVTAVRDTFSARPIARSLSSVVTS